MKIVITGCEGFVGRALIETAKERGVTLVGLDQVAREEPGFSAVDLNRDDIAAHIPEGVDAVIHLAGLTRDPDCRDQGKDCFESNVMATLKLMEAAQKRNVKQFIFASTEWVYDSFLPGEIKTEDSPVLAANLNSEYALSKFVSEQNLRQKFQHGFCDTTILRFGIIYGPRETGGSAVESLLNAVNTKDEVSVGCLQTGRCFIHVQDIVNGILAAIGLEGFNLLNLQGDTFVSLNDILKSAMKLTGKTPQVIETGNGEASIRNVSNAKAKVSLNWKPAYNIENGLASLWKNSLAQK